ncbi:MAG: hypothetical protein JJU34_12040 [Lunatimonas sp.]|uniref:hypothetical protein n=1 Tax=Lunatimonas sp. TaxID=2060141 RepID=UPI00263A5613|nr:hypothetical protein [Lunatimonas sp.]MCC5938002.1 hypothetical protein [Lunatimonas sp.]
MSKFERRFQLIQHTPMIHFQGDQMGATLRASELKPKLDEFLKKKIQNKEDYNKWLIPEQEEALNYKVRVLLTKSCENNVTSRTNAPMYFGDTGSKKEFKPGSTGNKKEIKHLNHAKAPLEVVIFSFYAGLLEEIETYFAEFLFMTNFGTRQSKGYGSFSFLEMECENFSYPYFEILELVDPKFVKHEGKPRKVDGDKRVARREDFVQVMKFISYYHQRLKSGVNFPREFKKSFLYKYQQVKLKSTYTWEKRWLKEKFIGLPADGTSPKFSRAFLGLSMGYVFFPKFKNKRRGEVYPNKELNIKIEHLAANPELKIARFKSPITFKPVFYQGKWRVYIIADSIPELMKNQLFRFSSDEASAKLATPVEVIKINDLILEFHKHLGSSFTAYDFNLTVGTAKIFNP